MTDDTPVSWNWLSRAFVVDVFLIVRPSPLLGSEAGGRYSSLKLSFSMIRPF